MKKIIVSLVLVGAIVAYVLFNTTSSTAPATTTSTASSTSAAGSTGAAPQVTAGQGPTPGAQPVVAVYKDGVYVGDAVDAFYGIVQVQATVAKGVLTKVAILQQPNDREHTIELSNVSLPRLAQEAIKAQSAKVDIVSGATQTSEGFIASLSSALTKAKI